MSPQPPGATALLLEYWLGDRVKKSILGHWIVIQLSSTRPPVSPEFEFQLLRSRRSNLTSGTQLCATPQCSFKRSLVRAARAGALLERVYCKIHML